MVNAKITALAAITRPTYPKKTPARFGGAVLRKFIDVISPSQTSKPATDTRQPGSCLLVLPRFPPLSNDDHSAW
ncbi:hypothetical protein Pen01_67610 [Phytomonospora endophytica]|nr:hypothetical protein Pen01_67610 [Phytomonospora endophytica]